MKNIQKSLSAKIVLALFLLLVALGIGQVAVLQKAHSSLTNYAAFRGCINLSDETVASATCTTKSGQTIKLVQINNKWYLEGDGPGIW